MLTLAPLHPDAPPLDAGERFALDLLLDCSCVLRAHESSRGADLVELRIARPTVGAAPLPSDLCTDRYLQVADGAVTIDRTVLTLVRDIAGRVAEQRSGARDRYGRVPSHENDLVRVGKGIEREAVVSTFARAIAAALVRAAGRRPALFLSPWPGGHRWAAALTHDLDVVDWWPVFTALRLAELARKGELARVGRVLSAALATGGRDVVARGLRQLLEAERAHGIRSTWFVLCGTPTLATARAGDLTYRPEGARARRLLAKIAAAGHEIGLHGSFATSDDPPRFAEQRARLAALTGAAVVGVRQHYLRLYPGSTPARMRDAGFAYDATAGFSDRNGFRLGVADVLPVWSDAEWTTLALDEVPFCWMDRALSKYQGVEEPAAWIDDALELADRCRAVQGLFAGIWHPNLTPALGFPGAPEQFARLARELVARGAYVAPLGELVAWRRARRATRATAIMPDGRVRLEGARGDVMLETADGARIHAG